MTLTKNDWSVRAVPLSNGWTVEEIPKASKPNGDGKVVDTFTKV
jgi:hypothetical protein